MEQIYTNPCLHGGKVLFCQKIDDGKGYHAEMKKRTQEVWKNRWLFLPFLFVCFSNLVVKIVLLMLSNNSKIVGLYGE